MKLRLDFVTNSSSSSFVTIGIYNEELFKLINEETNGAEQLNAIHHVGALYAKEGLINYDGELFGCKEFLNINWLSGDEEELDRRSSGEKRSDNTSVKKDTECITNLIANCIPNASDKLIDKIFECVKESQECNSITCRTYVDVTDGFAGGELFSKQEITKKAKPQKTKNQPQNNNTNEEAFKITKNGILKKCLDANITEAVIPDGVKVIENKAFYGLRKLTKVVLPEGVTEIRESAFQDCKKLSEVNIPSTVKILERFAFCNCELLETINNDADSIEEIGVYAFSGTPFLSKSGNICVLGNVLLFATSKKQDEYDEEEDEILIIPENVSIICSINGFFKKIIFPDNPLYFDFASLNVVVDELIIPRKAKLHSDTFHAGQYDELKIRRLVFKNEICESVSIKDIEGLEEVVFENEKSLFTTINGMVCLKENPSCLCSYPKGLSKDGIYTIPEGITSIYEHAEDIFENAIKVIIPSTLKEWNHIYLKYAQSIDVSTDNPYFASKDGVLFNKDYTELIEYPACKEGHDYTIPETVKRIKSDSLKTPPYDYYHKSDCLKRITIPSNVISIYADSDYINFSNFKLIVGKGTCAERFAIENDCNYEVSSKLSSFKYSSLVINRDEFLKGCKLSFPNHKQVDCGDSFILVKNANSREDEFIDEKALMQGVYFKYLAKARFVNEINCDHKKGERWNLAKYTIKYTPITDEEIINEYVNEDIWYVSVFKDDLSEFLKLKENEQLRLKLDDDPQFYNSVDVETCSGKPIGSLVISERDDFNEWIPFVYLGVLKIESVTVSEINAYTKKGDLLKQPELFVKIKVSPNGDNNNKIKKNEPKESVGISHKTETTETNKNDVTSKDDSKAGTTTAHVINDSLSTLIKSENDSSKVSENVTLPDAEESVKEEITVGKTDDNEWEIKKYKNGTVGIVRYNGNSEAVQIPNELFGKKVSKIRPEAFAPHNGETTNIKTIVIPDGMKTIGSSVFKDCISLESITIPDSITKIGDYAFENCTRLTNVTLGRGVTIIEKKAFLGCSNLSNISVQSGNAVYDSRDNCNAIIKTSTNELLIGCKNTTIPESVTKIGDYAFNNCTGLTNITIPDGVTKIGDYAFNNCTGLTHITIPDSVTSIDEDAFSGCTKLSNITIPDSVTEIGFCAFSDCTSLNEVIIGNGLKMLEQLFSGCKELRKVIIGDGVTHITEYAFHECTSLESVNIPKKVTKIECDTFSGCTSLKSVSIPNNIVEISCSAFDNCVSLERITIPDSVREIGFCAFFNCTSLEEVIIGNGLKNIGDWAFKSCTELVSVAIPDSVTKTGYEVFSDCAKLKNVVISNNLTDLDDYTFRGCISLEHVTLPECFNNDWDIEYLFKDSPNVKLTFVDLEAERKAQEEAANAERKAREEAERKTQEKAANAKRAEEIRNTLASMTTAFNTNLSNLESQIESKKQEKASLGFFKGKQKRALQTEIDLLKAEISKATSEYEAKKNQLELELTTLQ